MTDTRGERRDLKFTGSLYTRMFIKIPTARRRRCERDTTARRNARRINERDQRNRNLCILTCVPAARTDGRVNVRGCVHARGRARSSETVGNCCSRPTARIPLYLNRYPPKKIDQGPRSGGQGPRGGSDKTVALPPALRPPIRSRRVQSLGSRNNASNYLPVAWRRAARGEFTSCLFKGR